MTVCSNATAPNHSHHSSFLPLVLSKPVVPCLFSKKHSGSPLVAGFWSRIRVCVCMCGCVCVCVCVCVFLGVYVCVRTYKAIKLMVDEHGGERQKGGGWPLGLYLNTKTRTQDKSKHTHTHTHTHTPTHTHAHACTPTTTITHASTRAACGTITKTNT